MPAAGLVAVLALAAGLTPRLSGCQSSDEPTALAKQIASRSELIGGPGALGEVGDYLLQNDRVRVIIQGPGFSRGFGVYGGSLIDADLMRPVPEGGQLGGTGRDQFGELFPIFFLEAQVPEKIEVLSDGSDGGPAQVRVSGQGGDFLTMTKALNQAILNSHNIEDLTQLLVPDNLNGAPKMTFSTIYELAPGDQHVKIRTTMTNIAGQCTGDELTFCSNEGDCSEAGGTCQAVDLKLPSDLADTLLGLFLDEEIDLDVPLGHALLFGAGNKVFAPGVGYDIHFALEESYEVDSSKLPFPALPGLLSQGLVTTSEKGVSYGFFAAGDTPNFAAERKDADGKNQYEEAYPGLEIKNDSMLVPFVASAFTGTFYAQAPNVLPAGESFTFSSFFVVGNGDVGSVMDEIQRERGADVATLSGEVRDTVTLEPVEEASVLIYNADGKAVNQYFTDSRGRFKGAMPVGSYSARVEREPMLSEPVAFSLGSKGAFVDLSAPRAAKIVVKVRDESGRDLPAKATVVGTINPEFAGQLSRKYLFDLEAGQYWRASDMVADDPARPETLQYIESHGYTEQGSVSLDVRPGVYTVFVSRGIEYDVQKATIRVEAGDVEAVSTVLTRVVDTTGWIGADFHLHAAPSLDSSLSLHGRVVSGAGEGLEYLVSTDHNFVTDYRPSIEQAGLTPWVSSMIGLELTTLEAGHFNGFPVKRDVGKITRGSFEWSLRTPDAIFAELRSMGKFGPENTIIQVNHARDSILGYFSQYGVSELNPVVPEVSSGGFDIGALAATNGPAFRRNMLEDGSACEPTPENSNDCKLRSTFSFDFNAMEIFNGKRIEQIRSFRMPPSVAGLEIPEETVPKLPAPGTILCDGGDVAFPGMVDDWFNLLNLGYNVVGLGNFDSHNDTEDEIGIPRTFVFVGQDDPAFVDELSVVRAVQNMRAIATNGPFVELFVNGAPIGSRINAAEPGVEVRVKIQAPSWVDVTTANIIGNGVLLQTLDVNLQGGVFEQTLNFDLAKDTWFVVEVEGRQSLFPVVKPLEIGPVSLTDAVGSLAGAFGFGASDLGELVPELTHPVTPYAITNPVFVNIEGPEFTPPGLPERVCEDFGVVAVEGSNKAGPRIERLSKRRKSLLKGQRPSFWFPRNVGDTHDIRVLFDHFGSHSHAH
jgi:hypothetical protein